MTRLALLTLFFACRTGTAPEDPAEHDEPDEHAETEGDHAEVVLTPEAVVAARIAVAPATVGPLSTEITLPARIALDPRREAIVSAWIGGQVDAIRVRAGDEVRKGQVLATVQSPELGEAVAAFRSASALDLAADARLERLERLEADGVASRAQVLDAEAEHAEAAGALEAAEERLRVIGVDPSAGDPHTGEHYPSHVPVKSPIAGTVLTAEAAVGRSVQPGDTLFHVGDISEVWLLLDLYERDLAAVTPGQAVRFAVDAWPGRQFEGRIDQIGDWVEPASRTVEVRVVVSNAEQLLKPNMFATASLAVGTGEARGVVLPSSATQEIDGKNVVFVQEGAGTFEVREVAVAQRTSAEVLLTSGVVAGEQVVIDGAFTLRGELEKGELGEGHAH